MDYELVSGSSSDNEGDEHRKARPSFYTYTDRFYEVFPYYLSIGMTYEQFWEGDPTLTRHYRKADEIKRERRNQELWLQGLYFYEALCDVSPVLHAFAKKGSKPAPFPSSPYPLSDKQRKREADEKARKIADRGKKLMEAFMQHNNKRFGKKSNEGGE